MSEGCRFGCVPDFVVVEILTHLVETPGDLVRFGMMCRRMWGVVTSHPALWSRADPTTTLRGTRSTTLLSLAGTLTVRGHGTTLDGADLIAAMPNLRVLDVQAYDEMLEPRHLEAIPCGLLSLSLYSFHAFGKLGDVPLERFKELRSLRLSDGYYGAQFATVGSVLVRAPECLRRLKIVAREIRTWDLCSTPIRQNLLELSLRCRKADWDLPLIVACCPNLRSLSLSSLEGVRDLLCLSTLKHLTELSLMLGDEVPPLMVALEIGGTRSQCHSEPSDQHEKTAGTVLARELEGLANAADCEPFDKVELTGRVLDLSGFFRGRRCKGHLGILTLGCCVPQSCRDVIAECCGSSLARVGCVGSACSGFLVTLLSQPETKRPRLTEVKMRNCRIGDISEIKSLLCGPTAPRLVVKDVLYR